MKGRFGYTWFYTWRKATSLERPADPSGIGTTLAIKRRMEKVNRQLARAAICAWFLFCGFTVDMSAQWVPQQLPMTALGQSVHSPDGVHALLSGTYRQIAKTSNGGATWEQIVLSEQLNALMALDSLRAAWMLDENTLIVAGHNFFEVQEIIIRSVDGGLNWSIVQLGPDYTGFDDMHFTNSTTGIVIGQQGRIRRTTNAGATWSSLGSPTTRWLHDLVFYNDQLAFACGQEVTLYTTNGGTVWQQLPTHTCDCFDMAAGTPDVLYMVGVFEDEGHSLLRSANGGQTWDRLNTPFEPDGAVHAFGTDTVFSAAQEGLYASFDQGVSWYFFQETAGHWIQDIKFHDQNGAFAVGFGNTAFHTSNRGGTPRPVAWFEASDTYPCPGAEVQFTNLSPPGLGYEWWVDGSLIGTGLSFSHAFVGSGLHEVQLVVHDGPRSDTSSLAITAQQAAMVSPFSIVIGQDSVCPGGNIVMHIASNPNNFYQVLINGAPASGWMPAATAANGALYTAGNTDMIVEVVGRSVSACDTTFLSVIDTVQTIPFAGQLGLVAESVLVCLGDTPQVVLQSTESEVLYHVNIRYDGATSTTEQLDLQGDGGAHEIALPPLEGSVSVWCIGENALGCERAVTDTTSIAIDTVLAEFRSEPLIAFVGEPITMFSSGIGDPYFWDFGTGSVPSVSGTDSVEVTFSESALHHPIILGMENATGCSVIDTLDLTVLSRADTLDALACRMDSTGLHFGNSTAGDQVLDFVVDATGVRIVTGLWRNSYGSYYGHAAFIAKYDRDGVLLWEHRAPALNNYRSSAGMSLAVDAAGNSYMGVHYYNDIWEFAGQEFRSDNQFVRSHQGLLLKFAPDGTLLWHVRCDAGTKGITDVLISADGTVRFAVYGYPSNIEFPDGFELVDLYECCGPYPAFSVVHVEQNGHLIDVLGGPLYVGQGNLQPVFYYPYAGPGNSSYLEIISPTLFETCDGRIGFVDDIADSVTVAGEGFGPGSRYYAIMVGLSNAAGTELEQGWLIAQHELRRSRPWAVPDQNGTGLIIEISGTYWDDPYPRPVNILLADGSIFDSESAGCLIRLDIESGEFDWVKETKNMVCTELLRLTDGTFAYLGMSYEDAGIGPVAGAATGLAPLDARDILLTRFDVDGNVLSMNAYGSAQVDVSLGLAQTGCCELEIAGVAGGPISMQGVELNDQYGVFFARLSLDAECHPTIQNEIAFNCCGDTISLCQGVSDTLLLSWSPTGTLTPVSLWWSGDQPGQHVIATGVDPTTGHYEWHIPDSAINTAPLTVLIESGTGVSDSLVILFEQPPTLDLMASANPACIGDTILLTAQPGMTSYVWQDSISGGSTFAATSPGNYSVLVRSGNGCTASWEVSLTFLPVDPWLHPDTLVCDNVPTVLNVAEGFDQYLWSTGSTGNSASIDGPGMVTVQGWSGMGCLMQDTIQVTFTAAPVIEIIEPSPACVGHFIHVTSSLTVESIWSSGSTADSTVLVLGPNLYAVQGTDMYGCIGVDSVLVVGVDCSVGIRELGTVPSFTATFRSNGSVLHVSWNGPVDRIQLHDPLGRLLVITEVERSQHERDLDLTGLASGVYVIRASSPQGTVQSVSVYKP